MNPDDGDNILTGDDTPETIHGLGGNDTIDGKDGTDQLFGDNGDDTFLFTEGYEDGGELVDGGDGVDTMDFSGVDFGAIDGGEPGDTITGSIFVNLAAGQFGVSGVFLPSENFFATLSAVRNVENVIGSSSADTITGSSGANQITGGGGDDILNGGRGRDIFKFSGAYLDADKVNGGNDRGARDGDTLDFSGVDLRVLDGTMGAGSKGQLRVDLAAGLFGGIVVNSAGLALTDMQATATEIEHVIGSAFDDDIKGNAEANRLDGGDGNDTLTGGGGADQLTGGDGNDIYVVNDTRAVVIEEEDGGTDLVRAFGALHVLADNVENLTMNGRNRGFVNGIGNNLDNEIRGVLASDFARGTFVLSGLGGDDTIIGNSFADKLDGGSGDDTMTGGGGNDEYMVDSLADVVIEIDGDGIDTVSTINLDGYVLADNVENLMFAVSRTIATGTFTGTGNGENNVITARGYRSVGFELFGLDGEDTLNGGFSSTASDLLDGGDGNDKLFGNEGNDILRGGLGADRLDGGAGRDTADYSLAADAVVANLAEPLANAGEAAGDTYTSIENVTGSDFDDTIRGNTGSNTLNGGDGDDILNGGRNITSGPIRQRSSDTVNGGDGSDTITADNGDRVNGGDGYDTVIGDNSARRGFNFQVGGTDVEKVVGTRYADVIDASGVTTYGVDLFGQEGSDTLTGGTQSDELDGGSGNDRLTGGDGQDAFIFEDGWGRDTITDFQLGNIDALIMTNVTGLDNFAQLTITDGMGGAQVTFDGNTIVLRGLAAADVTADLFQF
jgi:Ca2+-binding RTX toxin-like protein